jgi:hypothetical protein
MIMDEDMTDVYCPHCGNILFSCEDEDDLNFDLLADEEDEDPEEQGDKPKDEE